MTELSVVPAVPQDDSNESNDMPKVDSAKLPSIPSNIPQAVLDYAKTGARGKVQVNHVTKYHQELLEHGKNLLSQHHAEGAAEQQLDTADEFADVRAELDKLDAEAETARLEFERLQDEADAARNAEIAKIVAKVHGDVDFEVEEIEYSTALINLSNQVKMFEAAGDSVQGTLRAFVKDIPTAKNLVEGKRGRTGKSTLPGGNNSGSGEGWKPRFDWIEVDGVRVPNVTTIGQLAKVLDNGKSYERILGTLTAKVPGRQLEDDKIYEWSYTTQNVDDGTETVTRFKGLALSRATMNARLQAGKASNDPTKADVPAAPAQASNNDAEPEVDPFA